jgi:nucleotide-binding universal stress UspA family protein
MNETRITGLTDWSRCELESVNGLTEQPPAPEKKKANPRTILVPVNFTRTSRPALAMAAGLAQANRAAILLVHVIEAALNFPPTGPVNVARLREQLEEEARRKLLSIANVFLEKHLDVHCVVMEGRPSEKILQAAEACGASLIVTGAGNASRWTRLFHRNTAGELLENARCPVLACGRHAQAALMPRLN